MKIVLSPEVERLIAERVSSGRYHSADEVDREGLDLLEEREKEPRLIPYSGPSSLMAAFESIAGDVPAEEWDRIPTDLSKNLDHYLCGGRKTS